MSTKLIEMLSSCPLCTRSLSPSKQSRVYTYILQFHLYASRHRDFSTLTNRSHCKTLPSPSQPEIPLALSVCLTSEVTK